MRARLIEGTLDDVVLTGNPLMLTRKSGKPVTINATDELLCVGGTGDACTGGTKVPLFTDSYYAYFWDVTSAFCATRRSVCIRISRHHDKAVRGRKRDRLRPLSKGMWRLITKELAGAALVLVALAERLRLHAVFSHTGFQFGERCPASSSNTNSR